MTKATMVEISLVLITLPGLQIFLSKDQLEWLEDKLVSLTLILDDLRPAAAYEKMKLLRVQIGLAVLTLLLSKAFTIEDSMNDGEGFKEAVLWLIDPPHWKSQVLNDLVIITFFTVGLKWFARGSINSFMKKAGTAAVVFLIIFMVAYLNSGSKLLNEHRNWFHLILFPFGVVLATCCYALIYILLIHTAQACVWLFSEILFKVVDHPKGALAAIVALDSILVGILTALISLKH